MRIKPRRARYRVQESGERLTIRMPYDLRAVPAPTWLIQLPLLFIGPITGVSMASAFDSPALLFVGWGISLFLVVVMGSVYASYLTLAEVIEVAPDRTLFERRFHFLGLHTSGTALNLDYVQRLRTEAPQPGSTVADAYADLLSKRSGVMALDYGQETRRFGVFVSEAECRMVVDDITRRFPDLAMQSPVA